MMQAYAEYKDSGTSLVELALPTHWHPKKCRFVFKFNKGLTITKENLQETGIPCVNYGEIHSKFGFEVDPSKHDLKCVDPAYLKNGMASLLQKGDFVFADTSEDIEGSGNFTCLNSSERTFAGYHTLIARTNGDDSNRFLAYVLDSSSFRAQVRKSVKGVKVYSITQAILKDMTVWFPPLPEQTAIAKFLDKKTAKIEELLAIKQRQIKLLDERKQILIQNAVTKGLNPDAPMKNSGIGWIGTIPEHWDVKKFRFLFDCGKGLTITKENLQDEGVPCVNYGEIHSKYGFELDSNIHPLKSVSYDYLKTSKAALLKFGDFVFADTSEDLDGSGNFTYLNCDRQVFAGYHTVIARPKFYAGQRYTAYFFESLSYRGQMRQKVKGVKVFSITQSILKSTQVIRPPLSEQIEITVFLDKEIKKINDAITIKQKQITKLNESKTTLINAAVTGKIKVA